MQQNKEYDYIITINRIVKIHIYLIHYYFLHNVYLKFILYPVVVV